MTYKSALLTDYQLERKNVCHDCREVIDVDSLVIELEGRNHSLGIIESGASCKCPNCGQEVDPWNMDLQTVEEWIESENVIVSDYE